MGYDVYVDKYGAEEIEDEGEIVDGGDEKDDREDDEDSDEAVSWDMTRTRIRRTTTCNQVTPVRKSGHDRSGAELLVVSQSRAQIVP